MSIDNPTNAVDRALGAEERANERVCVLEDILASMHITQRDKFAMAALPALLMVYDRDIREGSPGFDVAPRCYRIADAMLEARK